MESSPLQEQIEKLSDEIAKLSAHIDAATYRLLLLIREFDKLNGWQGARSCAHRLSWRCGIALGAAREKVRVARALEQLPLTSEALRKAKISYSKARAVTRVATPKNEDKLLSVALGGTTSHVERVVRAWRRIDEVAEKAQANQQQESRYLRTYTDEDGMLVVRARLTPEVGAAVLRALEAAGEELYKKDAEVSGQHRRADAIGLVAESALTNGLDNGTRADRYQVVVHVDAEVLADPNQEGQSALEDGPHVSAETSRRLACDSSKVVMTHEVEPLPSGELQFSRPSGMVIPDLPATPRLADDPVPAIMARHEEQGLEIDEWTSCPTWDGEPMDLDWTMCVLRQQ